MSRPTDWVPLAGADPVPGDPEQVVAMARRHGELAEQLTEQARMLRDLSTSEGWDSEAGHKFSRSAQDLAGRLDRTRRRYSTVAEALGRYAPKLRRSQSEADAARLTAKEAQSRVDANAPTPVASAAPVLTPEQAAVEQRRRNAHAAALQDVERARRRIQTAVQDRDAAAVSAARQIKDAIEHDGLKDSGWDKIRDGVTSTASDWWNGFTSWVHEHASWIKFVADVAGYLATALTFVAIALSVIPVLDFLSPILLGVALGLTVVGLVCHLMLALSGDGSWFEVGLDVFALVTLGYGRSLTGGLSVARAGLRTAARRALTANARSAARAETRALSRQVASRATRTAARRGAQKAISAAKTQARREAARTVTRIGEAETPLLQRLVFGDSQLTQMVGNAKAVVGRIEGLAGVPAKELAAVKALTL